MDVELASFWTRGRALDTTGIPKFPPVQFPSPPPLRIPSMRVKRLFSHSSTCPLFSAYILTIQSCAYVYPQWSIPKCRDQLDFTARSSVSRCSAVEVLQMCLMIWSTNPKPSASTSRISLRGSDVLERTGDLFAIGSPFPWPVCSTVGHPRYHLDRTTQRIPSGHCHDQKPSKERIFGILVTLTHRRTGRKVTDFRPTNILSPATG